MTHQASSRRVKIALAIAPFFVTVGVSIIFYFFFSPAQIIEYIGVKNAYILMWATAFLGGLTTFNAVPYYSVLVILATSGLNPFAVGVVSAIGVAMGDSYSYFVGRQGGAVFPESFRRPFEYLHSIAKTRLRLFQFICFVYGSISPLSNDFLTIPAGIAGIPYWQIIIPLALGNIVFDVSLAYLSVHAYSLISSIF